MILKKVWASWRSVKCNEVKDNKKIMNGYHIPIDTPFFKKEHLSKFYKEINLDKSNLFFMKSKILT